MIIKRRLEAHRRRAPRRGDRARVGLSARREPGI